MEKKIYTEIKNYLTKQVNVETYDPMSVVVLENGIVLWIYTDFKDEHCNYKMYDGNYTAYGYFFFNDNGMEILIDAYCGFYNGYFIEMKNKEMDILLPNCKIKTISKNDFLTDNFWKSTKALCPNVWDYDSKMEKFNA